LLEEAKKEATEKEEVHVAKPKLKKLVTEELKEEKEADIETATPEAPPEDKE